MIQVTAAAAEQIRAALRNQAEEGLALRVAARRAANGETEYGMGLDERREQDEEVVTEAGITLLVSPPSLEAIAGTVIDFVEIAPGEQRFIFYRAGTLAESNEPQSVAPDPTAASGGCSCGKGGCS
jgi:iron-sulfur cluster assembly accessory protein